MFSVKKCFIANEMMMFPSACTSLISFALTHTHTWNSYSINRQCGKAVLKHAFVTKNLSNIHTQVTIYTNVFHFGARTFFFFFFLAMSDYQGFLGEDCKNLQTHVIMLSISEAFRETSSEMKADPFHCLTSSYLGGKNKSRTKREVWFSSSWQPAAQVFKTIRKSPGSFAASELWFCPESRGQSQRLCLWCESVLFLQWGLQSARKREKNRLPEG